MRSSDASCKLEIWFVGGWVRHKLLGKQSSDVDIALSIMTGVQFGTILKAAKIINGPNPLMAFQLIYKMDLYSTVFLDPHDHLRGALLDVLPCQMSDCPWPSTWPRLHISGNFVGRKCWLPW
jgi:hypothetical protein